MLTMSQETYDSIIVLIWTTVCLQQCLQENGMETSGLSEISAFPHLRKIGCVIAGFCLLVYKITETNLLQGFM